MLDFDVFEEVSVDQISQKQLNSAISLRWVKLANRTALYVADSLFAGLTRKLKTWMTLLQALRHLSC